MAQSVKNPPAIAKDPDSIPWFRKTPEKDVANSTQYSRLGNQNAMPLTSEGFLKKKYFLSTSSLHSGVGVWIVKQSLVIKKEE